MTTKEFLIENRERVINFYNQEVKGYYSISLKDFMIDLMVNFEKRTIVKGLTKTDLTINLSDAKSRLGMMDGNIKVEAFDKRTEALRRKYKGTSAMAMV